MSILIKGMEMPTSCWLCHFQECGNCTLNNHKVVDNCIIEDRRDEDCPLIPVPDHGRLIDASALLQSIKEARKADPEIADVYDDDYFLVAEWVCSSPTIIPASGGTDNE